MTTIKNFSLEKIETLSKQDAKTYIDKFFIPLEDGNHAQLIDNKYIIIDDAILKRVLFKRMSPDYRDYYFIQKKDVRRVIYDVDLPTLTPGFLNLCPKMKQTYKKFNSFSVEIQKRTKLMIDHIKMIWCSNNEDAFQFTLKWLANMIKGKRNDSALYLKGPQGVGKSMPLEFIRAYVIRNPLSVQCGSGPLKNKFNSELSGKLLVMFEELENFNSAEWKFISSVLKRQITSPTLNIERKGCDIREETNLNNYVLISNNDSIQDDDGRRYFILDICTRFLNNKIYFNELHDKCFNDDVGQAFYSYLMEVDLKGYKSQDYPMTASKKDSFAKRLDSQYRFLKDMYIMKKINIERIKVKDMHDSYKAYCQTTEIKYIKGLIEFNKSLSNIGINYYPSSGKNYYKMEYNKLKEISDKFNWVHDLDEIDEDIVNKNKPVTIQQEDDFNSKIAELKEKINQQEILIKKLKKSESTLKKDDEEKQELIDMDMSNSSTRKVKKNKNKNKLSSKTKRDFETPVHTEYADLNDLDNALDNLI